MGGKNRKDLSHGTILPELTTAETSVLVRLWVLQGKTGACSLPVPESIGASYWFLQQMFYNFHFAEMRPIDNITYLHAYFY